MGVPVLALADAGVVNGAGAERVIRSILNVLQRLNQHIGKLIRRLRQNLCSPRPPPDLQSYGPAWPNSLSSFVPRPPPVETVFPSSFVGKTHPGYRAA